MSAELVQDIVSVQFAKMSDSERHIAADFMMICGCSGGGSLSESLGSGSSSRFAFVRRGFRVSGVRASSDVTLNKDLYNSEIRMWTHKEATQSMKISQL